MPKIFPFRKSSLLGIDFCSSAVKIVEIATSKQELSVEGHACESLPSFVFDGDNIKNISYLSYCIKKLLKTSGFTSKWAVLALPDSMVINQVVQMKKSLPEEAREEWAMIEAAKYIAYPLEEMFFDFEVLGPCSKLADLWDVSLIAARRENVWTRVQAVRGAGLQVAFVEVESHAIERAAKEWMRQVLDCSQKKTVALYHMRDKRCYLLVWQNGKLIFQKTFLEEDQEEFSNQKSKAGQIKEALQFFYSSSSHEPVDHLILAGSLPEQIEEQLGTRTVLAAPLKNLPYTTSDWMIACGLALRSRA